MWSDMKCAVRLLTYRVPNTRADGWAGAHARASNALLSRSGSHRHLRAAPPERQGKRSRGRGHARSACHLPSQRRRPHGAVHICTTTGGVVPVKSRLHNPLRLPQPHLDCMKGVLPASRRGVILKGIPSCLDPGILKTLGEMGHGDTLVIADANFPSESTAMGGRVHRADGVSSTDMMRAVLALVPLDSFVEAPVAVMQKVDDPSTDAPIVAEFQRICNESEAAEGGAFADVGIERVERFAFYERAEEAFAIIATGERRLYGNVIIKKGVIPPDE